MKPIIVFLISILFCAFLFAQKSSFDSSKTLEITQQDYDSANAIVDSITSAHAYVAKLIYLWNRSFLKRVLSPGRFDTISFMVDDNFEAAMTIDRQDSIDGAKIYEQSGISTKDWIIFYYAKDLILEMHKRPLSIVNGIITIWTRRRAPPLKSGIESFRESDSTINAQYYRGPRTDYLYTSSLEQINYSNKRERIIKTVDYNNFGNVIYSWDDDNTKWAYPVPNTIGEVTVDSIISHFYKPARTSK